MLTFFVKMINRKKKKEKNRKIEKRKKTFSGVYTNFKSFIPETYKIGLIKSLLFWCFSLCSDFIKFHHDIDQPPCIDKFRGILYKSSYSRVIWFALKNFLKKYWHQKLQ